MQDNSIPSRGMLSTIDPMKSIPFVRLAFEIHESGKSAQIATQSYFGGRLQRPSGQFDLVFGQPPSTTGG